MWLASQGIRRLRPDLRHRYRNNNIIPTIISCVLLRRRQELTYTYTCVGMLEKRNDSSRRRTYNAINLQTRVPTCIYISYKLYGCSVCICHKDCVHDNNIVYCICIYCRTRRTRKGSWVIYVYLYAHRSLLKRHFKF